MNFGDCLKDNIGKLLSWLIFSLVMFAYFKAMQVNANVIVITLVVLWTFLWLRFLIFFWEKSRYFANLNQMLEHLPEKYLLSEVMDKPRKAEDLAYYRMLKRINKSMLENVTKARMAQKAYKEYIESWVHEIKIPITTVKLLCQNHPSQTSEKIDEQMEEINHFVEQALFYARLDSVSNDFFIREVNLEEVVREVLARHKKLMIQNHMKVDLKNCDVFIYTDEKWLAFILHQILINSVQYKKEDGAQIQIEVQENKENVKLIIQDNGIGIKISEIGRIFDKGFTGTNGRKTKKSTGIGLYLCKRLCEELAMTLEVQSQENEYTKISIIIPRDKKEILQNCKV